MSQHASSGIPVPELDEATHFTEGTEKSNPWAFEARHTCRHNETDVHLISEVRVGSG